MRQNLIEKGILNNVEGYLDVIKKSQTVTEAKENTANMINYFKITDDKKLYYLRALSKKKTLTDVLMYAYNLNLSAEGLKV